MRTRPFQTTAAALALAALVLSMPATSAGHEAIAQDSAFEALEALALAAATAVPDGPFAGLPAFREEADGSVTLVGSIEDDPGATDRVALDPNALAAALGAGGVLPDTGLVFGLFARSWQGPDGTPLATVGPYVQDPATGTVFNVNQFALEGAASTHELITDAAVRDALPMLANVAPILLNYVQPTSPVFLLVLLLAALAVAVVALGLMALGFGELATSLFAVYLHLALSPVFMNVLYPYHTDPIQGEVYRDFPDQYVWRTIKRTDAGWLWEGLYLSRAGDFEETELTDAATGASVFEARAWKRVVVGPILRVADEETKLPGVYERNDVERRCHGVPIVCPTYEARSTLTTGAYHEATGETPGVSVRFDEHKQGEQTLLYPGRMEDTISLGLTVDGAYVPLVGTRTSSTHRPYTDVTNQGLAIGAIESHRVTSFGVIALDEYVPVFAQDLWTERLPADLWLVAFGLGAGLGDQLAGDLMTRTGVFMDGRFVAVAGSRLDDDFVGHRYTYRSMVSTGLFVTDPLDPGEPVPGESPDGAQFVPLHAATYDGVQGSTPWVLANAVDNEPRKMGTFLVSSGLGGPDEYFPLVGLEYVPEGFYNHRRAGESYQVGIFPADYATFVPLARATYDGGDTSGSWIVSLATHYVEPTPRRAADLTLGVVGPDGGYVPLASLAYSPQGTPQHPYGDTFTVGVFGPDGTNHPLVTLTTGMAGPPGALAVDQTCDVSVSATVEPVGFTSGHRPPCAP